MNFREQAIKDVAEALGYSEWFIEKCLTGMFDTLDDPKYVKYAVAQREARLREQNILRDLLAEYDEVIANARAALDAGKEG